MDGIVAYILCRNIAASTVTGIKEIKFENGDLVIIMQDGTRTSMPVPLPENGITPSINSENKHWMIGTTDTGIIAEGQDGKNGLDGKDGKDGLDGKDGKDGLDGIDGKDGSDGVSVVDIKINKNNHLICILSDGNELDAGLLPKKGGNDGGLLQVDSLDKLPEEGNESFLYFVKDQETIYYWDAGEAAYKPLNLGESSDTSGIRKFTHTLETKNNENTYNIPKEDIIDYNVYLNGLYQTEGVDYNIIQGKIVFNEPLSSDDLCTLVWYEGQANGSGNNCNCDDLDFATKEDIDDMFDKTDIGDYDYKDLDFATKEDIDNMFNKTDIDDYDYNNLNFATKSDIDKIFENKGDI